MDSVLSRFRIVAVASCAIAAFISFDAEAQAPNKLFAFSTNSVVQLDIDRDVITDYDVVATAGGQITGCQVGPKARRLYVADFGAGQLIVLKSSKRKMRVDPRGPNPIPVANFPEDMALANGGKTLLVASNGFNPLVAVNLRTRTQSDVSAGGASSVAACGNWAVVTSAFLGPTADLYKVRGRGNLSGPVRTFTAGGGPSLFNVHLAPDCQTGTALEVLGFNRVYGFSVPRMGPAGAKMANVSGFTGILAQAYSPDGSLYFVMDDAGNLQGWRVTDQGLKRTWSASFGLVVSSTFGNDALFHHPTEDKLYVLRQFERRISVYNSRTGELIKQIIDRRLRDDFQGFCGLPGTF